jgi:small GTP-binding protein
MDPAATSSSAAPARLAAPRRRKVRIAAYGDASVGKTRLLNRFTHDDDTEEHAATRTIHVVKKKVALESGVCITAEIFDVGARASSAASASRDPNHATRFQRIRAALLVFDVTNPTTLIPGAETWLRDLRRESPDCVVILVANKVDREAGPRRVSRQEGLNFAKQHQLVQRCMGKGDRAESRVPFAPLPLAYVETSCLRPDSVYCAIDMLFREYEYIAVSTLSCCS